MIAIKLASLKKTHTPCANTVDAGAPANPHFGFAKSENSSMVAASLASRSRLAERKLSLYPPPARHKGNNHEQRSQQQVVLFFPRKPVVLRQAERRNDCRGLCCRYDRFHHRECIPFPRLVIRRNTSFETTPTFYPSRVVGGFSFTCSHREPGGDTNWPRRSVTARAKLGSFDRQHHRVVVLPLSVACHRG